MRILIALLFVVAIARPAWADDEPIYHLSILAAMAAHGADLASSEFAFGTGAFHESNPWLGHFTSNPTAFGVVKMSGAAVGLWAASKIPNKRIAAVVNFSVAAAFSFVAYHNTKVLQ